MGNLNDWARTLLHQLEEAVFPSGIYCVSCGAMIDRSRSYSLCDDCIKRFHWITGRTCERCGKALPDTSHGPFCYDCMMEEHFFIKGFSCLTYGLYERKLMMDLKYAGRGYLARIFGDVMFDRLEMEISDGLFSGGSAASGDADSVHIDLIAPVPVSPGRLRKRGYNQSAVMAQQLARRWQDCARELRNRDRTGRELQEVPFAPIFRPHLLYRTRETQMLRSLNPTERRMVLREAFAVTKQERNRLAGKNVLLVDDIYTTGATADACGQALLEGGAAGVYLMTLASGGNRRPKDLT